MASDLFDRPVYAQRKYFVQEIATIDEAFDYLDEWASNKRDLAYEMVLRACREAACGRRPISAAREDFARFLKRTGKIASVEDVPPFLRRNADRNLSGA